MSKEREGTMAYSELIKDFGRIREYMRQFYVYGFKSRSEYDKKSARSYDNERRRMESWLGDYMRFRQTEDGKNVFLSVDSRTARHNPLHKAYKAKSFTVGDLLFHFFVMDLLADGSGHTVREIVDRLSAEYYAEVCDDREPDISAVRKKLKEYTELGLLCCEKQGRELLYSRQDQQIDLGGWVDALQFYSEEAPLGVIGSFLLDKPCAVEQMFAFKHHYLLHALDSQILLQILEAIQTRRIIRIENASRRTEGASYEHTVCPLKIYSSTQNGRQYLLCYHYRFRKLMFFRLDYIQEVVLLEEEAEYARYEEAYRRFRPHLWGTSGGERFRVEHIEMTVRFEAYEDFILQRLEREKRSGTVELLDEHTAKFTADVYDATELLPWIRTFTGRIVSLECSNPEVLERFYGDLETVYGYYGGDGNAV